MVDPVLEDAVNAVGDRTAELRQVLGARAEDDDADRQAEEAVCLAVRFALAMFLPAWVDAGCDYDHRLTDLLTSRLDEALEVVPENTDYHKSIAERRQKLEDYVTGRKTSLIA